MPTQERASVSVDQKSRPNAPIRSFKNPYLAEGDETSPCAVLAPQGDDSPPSVGFWHARSTFWCFNTAEGDDSSPSAVRY